MLAWGMLNFGEGYNKSDMWATGMQTLKWNTDYLLKTILDDPTDSATSEAEEFYIVYQVSVVGGKLRTQLLSIAAITFQVACAAVTCQAMPATTIHLYAL